VKRGPVAELRALHHTRLISTLLVMLGLAACSDGTAGTAAWGWGLLALLLATAGGYAFGTLRSRMTHESELREARAEARQLNALQSGWRWQTDTAHRPVLWQGQGQAPTDAGHLFDDAHLHRLLRAQQAFGGLRVQLAQPVAGSRGWLLRAVPRQDDVGRFCGFVGSAEATDNADSAQTSAATLPALLALQHGPALTAVDHGQGWQLQQFNAAAAAKWPQLALGVALPQALEGLPPPVVAAFGGGTALVADGWHLQPNPATGGGPRTLVLAQPCAAPGSAAQSAHAAQATQATQAAESDSFSFTVSHDLRAPIRVVEGFTRIVKEDYGRLLDRVGNDHLDRVLGAAARMNLMIDALLTLARLSSQPLAHQPVNLSQLANYVIDDLRRGTPEREAEVDIEPGLATRGDPTLLRLVLENLLGNAWKYSARCPKARISLATVPHGGSTAYVVRDNGAGFDMRSSDRLFGLFQRLHSASEFPGHGVGLASVRRIVRRHGGEIWAEAEPGRGAAFYFTLAG
jgi:signal transduction histidine kinase